MKILIACDQASSVDKLYYDLSRAGLPRIVEAYVFSVADVFVLPGYKKSKKKRPANQAYLTHVDRDIEKAQAIADAMSRKLKSKFSHWHFHSKAAGGSPAWEILDKAKEWKVDLIIVGAHGRIGVGEFFLGSVALKVLSESISSVRIVRAGAQEAVSSARVVIGVDSSEESDNAVKMLASRHWTKGSSVHLVSAIDSVIYTAFLYRNIGPVFEKELFKRIHKATDWIKKKHAEYKLILEKSGLKVSSSIKEGDPKGILIQEAKRWGADCIFVGAVGHSRMDRFLMGSVSTAVATRATCSVEVIRKVKTFKSPSV